MEGSGVSEVTTVSVFALTSVVFTVGLVAMFVPEPVPAFRDDVVNVAVPTVLGTATPFAPPPTFP
jgi:hypothetical protein